MNVLDESASYKIENNVVYLKGVLNFQSILPVISSLSASVETSSVNTINLQEVSYSNSAGIALLLEVLRSANKQHKALVVEAVPNDMRQLMRLCDMEEVFFPGG